MHIGLLLYFIFAFLSLLFTSPHPLLGFPKLLGVGELCVLAAITADLASRPNFASWIAKSIALTSLVTGAAAFAGLLLFYLGKSSPLLGIYGELEASSWYARVQAGTYNPNLLASFCIFAAAVVSQRKSGLPLWCRRVTLLVVWGTVLLTFSRGILGFVLAALIRNATTPRRRVITATCAAVLVCLTIALTIWKPVIDPAAPFSSRIDRSESSRYQAASSSLLTLVAHPTFGSGLGTHPGQYHGVPFDSHLTPLNIAATLGLPALIDLSLIVTCLWRRRSKPIDLALWGGLTGLALDGLAQDIEDFRHVWVLLGLLLASTGSAESGADSHRRD